MIRGVIALGAVTFVVLYVLFSLSLLGDSRNDTVISDAFKDEVWDRCCADFWNYTTEEVIKFKKD